jgi:hypothetical protein
MEHTKRTEVKEIAKLRSGKWAAGAAAMLLSASLLLSACGGSAQPVVEATAEAPAATTPAASDTTTDTTTEATATPEAESEEVDSSDTMTDTEGVDDSDAMTDTEGMDDSDTMTDTEGMDDSDTMTDTEGMDDSDTMTDTEGVEDSDTVTDTAGATDSDTTDTMPMMGVNGVDAKQYVRASTLLDYDFENLNDEVSGDIEDLLIDLSTGRVLFASIEYGGVLDLGDKDIVIPMNAFTIGQEGELILNMDEATLESYPDVGNDWPDLNDPAWDDDVNTYWTETGINVGPGYDEASTSVAWASDLMGRNIADLGTGAGSILDILVNLGTGYAPYFIVDYGEGLDTDPYIIPVAAFDTTGDWSNEFAYGPDFTPDLLESAPRFERETYPDGSPLDLDFGDRVESAWNDLGFSNDINNDGELD